MKVDVEVNFQAEKIYSEEIFSEIARETIVASGRLVRDDVCVSLSVAIVSEDEIRRVNREYRQKDHVTDVISIGDYSDERDISTENAQDIFLGEIILCYNYIASRAHAANQDVDQDFSTIFAHGVLHLLGFAHGDEMFKLQEDIGEGFSKKN